MEITHTIWFADTPVSAPQKLVLTGYSDAKVNMIASDLWKHLQARGFHMRNRDPNTCVYTRHDEV